MAGERVAGGNMVVGGRGGKPAGARARGPYIGAGGHGKRAGAPDMSAGNLCIGGGGPRGIPGPGKRWPG